MMPFTVIGAGSIIAGAVAIGHTVNDAVITEIVTLAIAFGYYLLTGRDSDTAAVYGGRTDERQDLVRMNATRLAFVVMVGVAFVCAVVTVAMNDNYWQADVIGSLGGVTYLFGLASYGAHAERHPGGVRGVMAAPGVSERAESYEDTTSF